MDYFATAHTGFCVTPAPVSAPRLGRLRHSADSSHSWNHSTRVDTARRIRLKSCSNFIGKKAKTHRRRSVRIPRQLSVVLRWHDRSGNAHQEGAETRMLSRYGGLVECQNRFKANESLLRYWPERDRQGPIGVVFCVLGRAGELSQAAFEFLTEQDFWEVQFPVDPLSLGS